MICSICLLVHQLTPFPLTDHNVILLSWLLYSFMIPNIVVIHFSPVYVYLTFVYSSILYALHAMV